MISLIAGAYLLQATYLDLYQSGNRLLEEGRTVEAEAVLKESATQNPKYVPALVALAESYVKLKRFNEAIDLYKRSVQLNPRDMNLRGRLAELYSWAGDYDKSIVTYKDSLELDPGNHNLKNGLAKVLRWSQRYDEAQRLYEDVLRDDAGNHEALKGLSKTYSLRGELTAALSVLDKAVRLYPDDAELHKDRGTVLAWQKDFKKAVVSLNKAVELSPKYADAYRTLGDVYYWMKSYQESIDAYKKALDLEPGNHETYIQLSRIYKITGNTRLAEEMVRAALKIDPSDVRALELLREIRESPGKSIVKSAGEATELAAFAIVFVALLVVGRSRRRMLKRKHRVYFYFINFFLPSLVALTFISYVLKDAISPAVDLSVIAEMTEAVLFVSLGASFFALLWTEHRSKEFSKQVILAVGAHPDDIELGCGGFILKAKDSGAKVYGLTMSKGEKGAQQDGRRETELRRAARFMELDGVSVLNFPDTALTSSITGMKDAIEQMIKETGATMVLTHSALDIHADHQAVFEATKVAARNISVLCYEDVSTPREFVPNYFVDVTAYIEDKMKLVSFHRSQADKSYMDPEVVKGRAAHRGIQAGVQYAEALRIYKILL